MHKKLGMDKKGREKREKRKVKVSFATKTMGGGLEKEEERKNINIRNGKGMTDVNGEIEGIEMADLANEKRPEVVKKRIWANRK